MMLQLLSARLRYISLVNLEISASLLRKLSTQCLKLKFISVDERTSLDARLWLEVLPNLPSLTHLLLKSRIFDSEEEIDLILHLSQRPDLEMLCVKYGDSSLRREARLREAFRDRYVVLPALRSFKSLHSPRFIWEQLVPRMPKLQSIGVYNHITEVSTYTHIWDPLTKFHDLRELQLTWIIDRHVHREDAEIIDGLNILARSCPQMQSVELFANDGISGRSPDGLDTCLAPGVIGNLLAQWPQLENFQLKLWFACNLSLDELQDLSVTNAKLRFLHLPAHFDLLSLQDLPDNLCYPSLRSLEVLEFKYPEGGGPQSGGPYEKLIDQYLPNLILVDVFIKPTDARTKARWRKLELHLEEKRKRDPTWSISEYVRHDVSRKMIEDLLVEIDQEKIG